MRKFLVGAILTYAGLALFLLGFVISTVSIPALDNMIMALIPMGMAAALVGVIIQILSGIIGVTGLLLCIASVSKPTPAPVTIIQQIPVPTPPPLPPQRKHPRQPPHPHRAAHASIAATTSNPTNSSAQAATKHKDELAV